jgi:hypothetical protein
MIAEQVLATARAHGLRTARVRALHVLAVLCERSGDAPQAIALEREAVALVHAGAAPLDGVRSIHHLGKLLVAAREVDEGRGLLREAARVVQGRLDDLEDEELRRGYLEQPDSQAILRDGAL